ncbi:MAG: bifunctional phosphoribosylaminoimidazolecarboxamide formyltransferase/IMP cyclohydrolase, partial [Bacteroidales bacterium]
MTKKIKNALISVFSKDGLDEMVKLLHAQGVVIYSTGGTYEYIKSLQIPVLTVESLTSYPSILGGRVKTLHPLVFGGILGRRDVENDLKQMEIYGIPEFDLVVVDLYPFEKTVAAMASQAESIEKIDIGGISLIRAAAKNFKDVVVVPSVAYYAEFNTLYAAQNGTFTIEQRRRFATYAFGVSSHYDSAIFNYFNQEEQLEVCKLDLSQGTPLRYGENPHQKARFFGDLDACFTQLHGKELSYNNLSDVEAALSLIDDFSQPTFAIVKHNNACGLAQRDNILQAWTDALAGDPISAFGGVFIANRPIDKATAEQINTLFFEVLIAPAFDKDALSILETKKNRILLERKPYTVPNQTIKTVLNGVLIQDRDTKTETSADLHLVSQETPNAQEIDDLLFANKIVKHSKSNAIVLAKNGQLLASGIGQTSRVDALEQAIVKAKHFKFDLNGAVMASDAFFPFADCVEIAHKAGIHAIIQPGGLYMIN